MNLSKYKTLISNLPVRQQCFTTKRSTWLKAEQEIDWLEDLNNKLFGGLETLNVSRQDIFNSNNSIRELILKTIYWGYTGGMRGNHFVNILKEIQLLEKTLRYLKSTANLTTKDFADLTEKFKIIPGLGLSTYSKLLYFLEIEFDGNPCLILDQRLIDVFNSKFYNEYSTMGKISDYNKEGIYLSYLDITNKLSLDFSTKGENIEQFLFMFGNNLKTDNKSSPKLSQIWNGYCPESWLQDKTVRMRLNQWDFFESEETRLQICLNGIQAVVLNFRGKGKFRSTSSFGDEVANGQFLSPQNTDRPPFNNPTVIFKDSEQIEDYITAITE